MASATIRNLGSIAAALTARAKAVFKPAPSSVGPIDPEQWPSPLEPVTPWGPVNAKPLNINIQYGQNQIITPRSDAKYTAAELKNLALYPLARYCINSIKNQIGGMKWKIQAKAQDGETNEERKKRQAKDPAIGKLTAMFEYPDGESEWGTWVKPLIEEYLTIDAACVLTQRNLKGDIVNMPCIPGDTITRYVDQFGFTPKPPYAAYAQLWEGLPRVNLTTRHLVYRPWNIVRKPENVASYLYGQSATESGAEEICIGIQRLNFVLAYYKEGSIPGVVHIVPPDTPVDNIKEAMAWMTSELAGNLASKHQWRMIQGFNDKGNDQIEFTKQALLTDAFDEMHIRKICFQYGVSPQRLLHMMNRATAGTNQESADLEGLETHVSFVEAFINYIIQIAMGMPGYEISLDSTREPDIQVVATTDASDVNNSICAINEKRVARGLDKDPNPLCDVILMKTPMGLVPLGTPPPMPPGVAGGPPSPNGGPPRPKPNVSVTNAGPKLLPPGKTPPPKGKQKLIGSELEKFSYGSTQADVPEGSGLMTAIRGIQDAIDPDHLAGKGIEEDPHVTVRNGIQDEDLDGIREYLHSQAPFFVDMGDVR